MSDATTAHCGHIDSPCACDNAPAPVQAYHAMRRERDEARAELAERDAILARVRNLFTGGPDTPCRTTWPEGIECVEVPMSDLRRALDGLS